MITKSLAGVAAGVLLIGGGALATAQANPAPSSEPTAVTTASATAAAQAAGAGYPASVVTTTNLRVPDRVRRGTSRNAVIVVRAGATKTTPRGTVTLNVAGKQREARLRDGRAVIALPNVAVGRHTARAAYHPRSGSQWKRSSDTARYRVTR